MTAGFRINRRKVAPYLFILPNMVLFGLFTIYPAINGFNLSFYDSNNGLTFHAVGTDNYRQILDSSEFWDVARQTALFVIGFVALSTVLATALALLLHGQRRGRGALSAAYFLPMVVSPVVVGLIWNAALNRQTGLVNSALAALGLGHPAWLVDPQLALVSVILVGTWIHLGFYAMIMLAGLQAIDESVYEAATIDGAGTWQRIRLITLPLVRPTTLVVIMLATIAGFQAFDFIYTLTGGGPVGATTLLVQYVYVNAFHAPVSYGLASAAAVILFLVVFAVTFLNYLVGRRREAL
ncbi:MULTISPECIES: carbohydrate ABC transporter permease [unclassified Nocardia]|uniref:carbohydrate ABC transporter permease n=1 Tax=unclassified Nocardia TaxID=2637762 RepID=UPI001CE4A47F|nr:MULTISPECIES: sugar ABC transporter permease [unclassified Nocardia]